MFLSVKRYYSNEFYGKEISKSKIMKNFKIPQRFQFFIKISSQLFEYNFFFQISFSFTKPRNISNIYCICLKMPLPIWGFYLHNVKCRLIFWIKGRLLQIEFLYTVLFAKPQNTNANFYLWTSIPKYLTRLVFFVFWKQNTKPLFLIAKMYS